MGHARQSDIVAAGIVILTTHQLREIRVSLSISRLPWHPVEMVSRHLALIAIDDAETISADGLIKHQRMRVRHDLTSHLFHLTTLNVIKVTKGETGESHDILRLLTHTVERHCHREGRHQFSLHLVVSLVATDGVGYLTVHVGLVGHRLIIANQPHDLQLEREQCTARRLEVFEYR